MKKLMMTMMLCCIMVAQASAQEIFQEVQKMIDGYQTVRMDTTQNLEVRKLATFKWDAINYMITKGGDDTEAEFGQQVSSMIDFVDLFLKRLKNCRKDEDKQLVLAKFKNATIENARFNDMEKEIVYAYVDNNNFLTQFSLDTDWVKALEEVTK